MCTNQDVNAGAFRTSSNYLSKVMLVHDRQMCGYISKSTAIWSNMLMNTFHSVVIDVHVILDLYIVMNTFHCVHVHTHE